MKQLRSLSRKKTLDIPSRGAYNRLNLRPQAVLPWTFMSDTPPRVHEDFALTDWNSSRMPEREEHAIHIERRAQTWMLGLLITLLVAYGSWLGVEIVALLKDSQLRADQIIAISEKVTIGQTRIFDALRDMGIRIDRLDYRLRRVEKNPTKRYDVDDDAVPPNQN